MGVPHGVYLLQQDGKLKTALAPAGRNAAASPGTMMGWIITNYERLKKLAIPTTSYGMSIDEATYIKNTKSQRSKTVLQWAARADYCLALTGTPIVNRPLDLWAIYVLLRERAAGEFWNWAQRYTGAYKTPYGWDFSGATHLDELAEDISHFALRREKKDVLGELPPKRRVRVRAVYSRERQAVVLQLGREVCSLADAGMSLATGEGFGSVQRLRVESALAKVPFCNDWLAEHFAGDGSPVLVFSAFKAPLRALEASVNADRRYNGQMALYTGDQGLDERTLNKQLLQQRRIQILGLTYDAGGMGLNLQAASTVIILDPPWTPKDLEQAEDRAHRIGQTQEVMVVQMIGDDPIEAQMYQGLDYKQTIAEAIHGSKPHNMILRGAFARNSNEEAP